MGTKKVCAAVNTFLMPIFQRGTSLWLRAKRLMKRPIGIIKSSTRSSILNVVFRINFIRIVYYNRLLNQAFWFSNPF